MGLDRDAVGRMAGPSEVSWDSRDAMLYALGVGAGQSDPFGELNLTTENSAGQELVMLPAYGVVLTQRAAAPRSWPDRPDQTRSCRAGLHAAQAAAAAGNGTGQRQDHRHLRQRIGSACDHHGRCRRCRFG